MLKKVYKVMTISVIASFLITGCSVKPEPIPTENVKKQVQENLIILSDVVQPVTKAISLDEAIQRGLEHNLQKRVKLLETAMANQQLDLVYYDMLPNLTASAGYSERNNYAASASTSFNNGEPAPLGSNPQYSVSQDKERTTADIGFSWNILDFGLSYVRAQQQADKFLIAKEKQKKVEHNLTQEIRRAYYQAVSSQDLLKRIQPMMSEVKKALEDSKQIQNQRVAKSPMEALSYQRELLDILRSLHTLENSLISAKIELAELMGLKPGIQFDLADKVEKNYELPSLNMNLDEMELIALENRPELSESRYQERITQKELTVAKLKMLPGINLNTSLSYENSDYLLNNDWYSYGANVSWNLLNIFKAGSYNKLAKSQIEIAKEQNLALSMAVLSQVHLSIVKFNQAKKEYYLAKEYLNVADEIYNLTKVENDLNINSRLVLIKEKLNNILATLRYSSSYANVQNSYGRIFASLGIDENSIQELGNSEK
jgi:outer membrane protein TolC